MTAAWKWAAAVPLVHSSTAGRPVATPRPRATNDADRSSWWTWRRIAGSAANANAKGVDREPGATTASVTPARTHSSTRVAQKVAAVVTGTTHSLADMGPAGEAGARIHVEVVGAGEPRLVLVHGFTQTGRSWRAVADDLATDHEVALVDAPGHGGSSAVRAGLSEGARAIVDAAGAGIYVGYSMGARYALNAALARPDAVQGVVLLGVNPGIEDPVERAARCANDEGLARRVESEGVDAFLQFWLAQALFASLPVSDAEIDERRRNTVAGLAASLRHAGTGAEPDVWGEVGGLAMPVLVLAGGDDAKFRAIGERLALAIGANARFAVVPGAGHAAHLEQPEVFLRFLREWLANPAN
jgi:2-succinyl-6-hydroxy-2,4-cyclohexadiene-1-carboxylate synthase